MSFPGPPVLKTTIIQLNKELGLEDSSYEILTNEYLLRLRSAAPEAQAPAVSKKKRRRLLAIADLVELLKRKHETKQLHSIIEKRRRIKINREFEALKYLIPACRSTLPAAGKPQGLANGNKIDGMYKLTILKLLVEYILYLHHIIELQHKRLAEANAGPEFNIDFARVPLDVNAYRNIDKDFLFKGLLHPESTALLLAVLAVGTRSDSDSSQLPSPEITPDMAPVMSLLHKYASALAKPQFSPLRFGSGGPGTSSTEILPFLNPVVSTYHKSAADARAFHLPDPALTPLAPKSLPKRRYFRKKLPENNVVMGDWNEVGEEDKSEHDASKTLLALRKLSIDSLLN